MTKLAAMPIYDKNLKKIFFSGTKRLMTLKLGMQHRVLKYYQVYLNDYPGLTLIYFTARSNVVPYAFVWEKGKAMYFSETIVVCCIKVGRCKPLNLHEPIWISKAIVIYWPWSKVTHIFKLLFLRNHLADWSQISCGAAMWWGNEHLFKWSWSHDQDCRHAHIW